MLILFDNIPNPFITELFVLIQHPKKVKFFLLIQLEIREPPSLLM